jgi:hypothetical protein
VGTWTASATGGTGAQAGVSGLTITSSANGAAIALVPGNGSRTAGILTAGGTSPTITQDTGASNTLSIGAGVEIALGGVGVKLGEIVLKNSNATNAADNGKISLLGSISTGNEAGTNQAAGAPLATDQTTTVSSTTAYTGIGVLLLAGDGTNAKVAATNDPADGTTSVAGKIAKLLGTTDATVTGGNTTTTVDGSADGKISGATATVATA